MNLPINQIVQGDCLEVMKDWPDNCVDLVLTDPPYGVEVEYDRFKDTRENLIKLISKFMPETKRISKVVAFTPGNGNQRLYPEPSWTLGLFYTGGVNYCRWGFNCWQPVLVYGQDPKLRDGLGCWPDAFRWDEAPKNKLHPCPEPIGVMKWLVNRLSGQNDLILDPFCSSGTTCVAAKMLGRRCIGIDISEEYCQIARERLRACETGVPVAERRAGQQGLFDL